MAYTEDYKILQKNFKLTDDEINIPELNIRLFNVDFHATRYYHLPGVNEFIVSKELADGDNIKENHSKFDNLILNRIFDVPDMLAEENNMFKYILLTNSSGEKAGELILLFHGLNEKSWAKYLSWGLKLHQLTGKAVMFFPITFHMNRCPETWSNRRLMNDVANERKASIPDLCESSFANAAISTRLTLRPQRFFYSGFQTYYDLMKLLQEIRHGENHFIKDNAHIDIFSYSIGAFLSEILFFSGSNGLLGNAKLCMFCGGTTTDRFRPVVKTIMDSAAFERFHSFYALNFENEVKKNRIMSEFYKNPLPEALAFKSLLSNELMKDYRECKLRESAERIYAVPLEQDLVIPAVSVKKTLAGDKNEIPINVETFDFPYRYTHESPFPINDAICKNVDANFDRVFEKFADFLS